MYNLAVEIVRFVDDHQPGWVACEFVDAAAHRHTLIDKAPIFTAELLDATSSYPQPGLVGCEVLSRLEDDKGRELVRVTTIKPWDMESTEGLSEFVVLSTQLTAGPEGTA
jgi:hypothetical protein